MDEIIITDEDRQEGAKHETLGPAYFAARRICRKAIEGFEADHMKPLVDGIVKEITDKVWDNMTDFFWCDLEMNLQGRMYHAVDDCVKALLTGEEWALKRYALGSRYDHEKVRKAVAAHIPAEIQDARIKDLEAEIERLKERLEWETRR